MTPARGTPRGGGRRRSSEAGAVTLWLLGMCMVLFALGGLSLDLWRAFSHRRAVAGIVDAAAVAGASGVDTAHYRSTGQVRLDLPLAEQLARANLARQADPGGLLAPPAILVTPEDVTVSAQAAVELTLLKVLLADEPALVVGVSSTVEARRSR